MAEATWIRIQRKTFTRWCNTYLLCRNLGIANLETDLADGVVLHNLLEILTAKDIKPKATKQKMKVQKVEQINKIIRVMQSRGLKVVAIGGEDIHDGNTKLILGLIWVLILRFQIEADTGASTSDLLDWCNKVLNPQGIKVDNFKDSWQDGRGFCGLVNALQAGTINIADCPADKKEQNLNRAFAEAEKHFQFPRMLDAEDILEYPDDLSIMTYVSYFRGFLATNTADPMHCICEGEGLKTGLVLKPAEFIVKVRNDKNEPAERGGAPIRCFLRDEKDVDICRVNVLDNRNGSYSCNYESPVPGKYFLHVRIGPNPVKDSPFTPDIISGEPFPGKCVAIGPGATKVIAGQLAEFKIQAKDSSGNNLDKGGTTISAVFKDPTGPVTCKIVDNGDGTYTGSYTPTTSGNSDLVIEVKTEAFGEGLINNGQPYSVHVLAGAPVAANTVASGPGLKGGNAGVKSVVTVQAHDQFNNKLTVGGAPINATLLSKTDGRTLSVDVKDNNDGTYTLQYVPEKMGAYQLDVKLGDQHIKNAPFDFNAIFGLADALNCEFSESDLTHDGSSRNLVAGVTDTIKIFTKDAYGNPITSGGAKVEGIFKGDNVPVQVHDNGDGSYTLKYTPTVTGKFSLDVLVGGKSVGGKKPLPVVVSAAAPNAAASIAYGPGLEIGKLDHANAFTVESRDQFGNKVPKGGCNVGGKLVHVSSGDAYPITAVDNGDGTYTCSYPSISQAGDFQVIPTLNGTNVKGAPFKLVVNPGSFSLAHTAITFDSTTLAGFPGGKVALKDSFKNPVIGGGEQVEPHLLGASQLQIRAKDNKNGQYDLIFPADFRGKYDINVFVNNTPAPGGHSVVDVLEQPIPDDIKNDIKRFFPKTHNTWLRILSQATPDERTLIIREMRAVNTGKKLDDGDVHDLHCPAEGYTATIL